MTADADGLQATWSEINQLLQSEQYNQAAELLNRIQVASEQTGNQWMASSAAAVRQICLACSQLQAIGDWHLEAVQEAGQRQDQLKQHAQSALDWISGHTILATDASSVAPAVAPTRVGPRQRFRRLLERGESFIRSLGVQRSTPEGEEAQTPAVSVAQQWEQTEEALTPPVSEEGRQERVSWTEKVDKLVPERQPDEEIAASTTANISLVSDSETINTAHPEPVDIAESQPPTILVYCLGTFRVYQDDQAVEGWQNSRGQSIFKYLIMHRTRPTPKEVLMDLFWPDATPEAARNNLNVAIYSMRRALRNGRPDFPHVIFQNDSYVLNPELNVWVDVEEFRELIITAQRSDQSGEQAKAIEARSTAEALYKGEFLADDRYEEWVQPLRQSLQSDYVTLLNILGHYYLGRGEYDLCSMMCNKLLAVDPCDEECHRNLMRCYSRQEHVHLALRQYHICVEALARELDVEPSTATTELYAEIRQQRPV